MVSLAVEAVTAVETADGGIGPVFLETARGDGSFDPGPVSVSATVTVSSVAR